MSWKALREDITDASCHTGTKLFIAKTRDNWGGKEGNVNGYFWSGMVCNKSRTFREGGQYNRLDQDLFCIAWCSKDMCRLARAFSQSLSIDSTHNTVKIDNM